MGIRSKLDGVYSIGLGTEAVNALELARAYSTLAHGGRRVDGAMFGSKPRVIVEVTERGRKRFNAPVPREALTSTQAGMINAILQKAVRLGTGTRAYLPDRPVAGKTGTTENYGDAWFVGYTPQLAVAVWVGYPDTLKPMLTEFHGEPVAGGTFPALIWKSLYGVSSEGQARPRLPVPDLSLRLVEAGRPARRPAHAGQRRLQCSQGGRLLRRQRAEQDGELPRKRGAGTGRAPARNRRRRRPGWRRSR